MLDCFAAWLTARAAEVEYNGVVLLRELRAQGYPGGLNQVHRFVRPLRLAARRMATATMRFQTAPGQQAQVDFGQRRVWIGEQAVEARMVTALAAVPEATCLTTIPKLGPVTAAIFLGAIGDPQAYEAGEQILRVAGLSLIERSSGILRGTKRLSKRGRPLLRQAAYMFAVRSITTGGLFRAEYDALMARNGGQAMKALGAVMRSALRLMFSIARDRRTFTVEPPARPRRVFEEAPA